MRSREACEPDDIGLLQQVRLLDALRPASRPGDRRRRLPARPRGAPALAVRLARDRRSPTGCWPGRPGRASSDGVWAPYWYDAVLALDRVRAVAPARGRPVAARRRGRGGLPAGVRAAARAPTSPLTSHSAGKLTICTLWAGDLPGRVTAGSRVTGTVAPSRGHLQMQLRHRRHRSAIALTAGLLAVVTGVSTTTSASFAAGQHRPHAGAEQHSDPGTDARGGFDARRGSGDKARAALLRDAARAASRPETRRFRGSLGDQTLLDLDGTTGTVRMLTRLDGYLTGTQPTERRPRSRSSTSTANHDALGPDLRATCKTFHLRARLRRHRRHPPPVLDAAHRRHDGLRQRPDGRGHQGRPAAQPGRLAGHRGDRRRRRGQPELDTRRPGHRRGPRGPGRRRRPRARDTAAPGCCS